MIIRRRIWHYNTMCSAKVRKIEFNRLVTKAAVRKYIAEQHNKLVRELWAQ